MNTFNNHSAFHIQLLTELVDMNKYPVTQLIIDNNLSKEEWEEIVDMLQDLDARYKELKEARRVNCTPLLIEFAGRLNEKLNPNETIAALKKEKYFPSLMHVFTQIIKREEQKYWRSKI